MASKINVELTSHDAERAEWTWRAAGARNPRGTVPASLVWEGAKVGDVARAEIARTLDGFEILSLVPPRPSDAPDNRIEVVGSGREEPAVTVRTVQRRQRSERPRAHREAPAPGARRNQQQQREQGAATTPPREGSRLRARRSAPAPSGGQPVRLYPRDVHRKAFLASVIPEHRPIAEALVRGGMPEVRKAIARDRDEAAAQGRPAAPEEATLKIAEDLLPRARVAIWLDRAEAALPVAEQLALRDLRSVVAAVDPASEDPRVLEYATTLRGVLERRVAAETERWISEIRAALAANRTVRALRLAARLPDPSARLPEDLVVALLEATNRELVPETPHDRWMVLIDAVANSPIRRQVQAAGLPEDAPPELLELAREHAGRIPSLGALLGVTMAAPPKPEILAKVPRVSRRPRKEGSGRDRGTDSATTSRDQHLARKQDAAPSASSTVAEPAKPDAPAPDAATAAPAVSATAPLVAAEGSPDSEATTTPAQAPLDDYAATEGAPSSS